MRHPDWLDTLRYDHPGKFALMVAGGIVLAFFSVLLLLPESPILQAMGVSALQRRIGATTNAIYWSSRAYLHPSGKDLAPVRFYGNLEGVDTSGAFIASIAEGNRWVRRRFVPADIRIVDLYGVAQTVGSLRFENAKFDVYPADQAVVWIHGAPLNIKLIEAGLANPDPNPPTNIVDVAFATYYWAIVRARDK